jgi:hypothetical protein
MSIFYRTVCDRCGNMTDLDPHRVNQHPVAVNIQFCPIGSGLASEEFCHKITMGFMGTVNYCADCANVVANILAPIGKQL